MPVHGGGGQAVERKYGYAADCAADEGDQQGFDHEGEDHGGGAEAKGAHGGDFAAAFGDRGVHGVESAEDCADGHDARDQAAEDRDQLRHARGLLGVVVDFAADIDRQARVGGDGVLELLQRVGRSKVHGDGLEDIAGALVDVVEHAGVAPDFGIEGAAAGVEYADHFPLAATETRLYCQPLGHRRWSWRSCRR